MKTKFLFSKRALLLPFFLVFSVMVFAQNVGDFKSKTTGGAWTVASTWLRWDGNNWIAANGYPGDSNNKGKNVTISCGTKPVTITGSKNNGANKELIIDIGDIFTINGILEITGKLKFTNYKGTNNTDHPIDIQIIGGQILWGDNGDLYFPANSSLTIMNNNEGNCNNITPGLSSSGCSASQRLYIGQILYSTCNGGGNAVGSFPEINAGGGSPFSFNIGANTIAICESEKSTKQIEVSGNIVRYVTYLPTLTYTWTASSNNPSSITLPPPSYSNVGSLQFNQPTPLSFSPTNLTNGDYTFNLTTTFDTQGSTISRTNSITINIGGAETVYNGTTNGWSKGAPSASNHRIAKISADYSTATGGSFEACSCTVDSGKTLTISPDTYVKLEGALTNNGNVVIQHDGNLLQVDENPSLNTTNITVERNILSRPVTNKYLFWSSPVKNQNMYNMFTDGTPQYVMSYNTATDLYTILTNPASAERGKGYSVKNTTSTGNPFFTKASFTGVPNNGTFTLPLNNTVNKDGNTYNLVGNPYPSNMNLVEFYNYNQDAIGSTFYFWDNILATQTTQTGAGAPTWAVFNAGSGTWDTVGGTSINNASSAVRPGQAFLVTALTPTENGTAQLKFKNAGLREAGVATTANRPAAPSSTSTTGKYWIEMTTPSQALFSTAVTYGEGASNDFDTFDSKKINETGIYTTLENHKLAIQGRSDFSKEDVVQVGFNNEEVGNFVIHLAGTEGVFANHTAIILRDKATGIETDLTQNDYSFAGEAGITEGRFEIMYKPGAALDIIAAKNEDLQAYRNANTFTVQSTSKNISEIEVYDAAGRLWKKLKPNTKTVNIDATSLSSGMYILKINRNGEVINKKIMK